MTDLTRRGLLRQGLGALAIAPLAGVALANPPTEDSALAFLRDYEAKWLPLEAKANEAAWSALTDVSEAHTKAQVVASQALNEVVGAPEVIDKVRALLAKKAELSDLTVRQLEKALLRAAEAPGTVPNVVRARVQAEADQSAAQDGFVFKDPKTGASPSANDIDRVLANSRELDERQRTWEVSKTIGGPLRDGLLRLRDLRNQVARALGHNDFFALQVADYGLAVPEMVALTDSFVESSRPLYEQLHCWSKHELAKRYGATPPEGPLPAHWLPNRWAQNWPGLVEGVDMDAPFKGKTKEYVTEQAERFYVSLGFPGLPKSFYEKSDLYPAPPGGRRKNSHASAWHVDLKEDVRSLMSVEPNNNWFNTAHHELGHVYYYMSYSRPEVPYLLRAGANRAFHEGIGDLIGLASSQKSYLRSVGLLGTDAEKADPTLFLLDAALDGASIVFLPFAAGTMTQFERGLYEGTIKDDALNAAWWDLVLKYQGVVPPGPRPEKGLCDPATKTHINDDAAQYYDYAIGTIVKFQLHDHVAREILNQDPRDCNYSGSKKVGAFLKDLLALGATRDWNAVLKEATGSGLSARPMVEYFAPLMAWLQEKNAGRVVGWTKG